MKMNDFYFSGNNTDVHPLSQRYLEFNLYTMYLTYVHFLHYMYVEQYIFLSNLKIT